LRKRKAQQQGKVVIPPVELVPHERLSLAPYNPNEMTMEERDALRASIVKHGLVENLVAQKRSEKYGLDLVLIGGHQRLGELRAIRAEEGIHEPLLVPCVVLDVADDEAMQLNVALNNIGGHPDPFKLGQIFAEVLPHMTGADVLATGFTQDQLSELVRLTLPPDEQARLLEDGVGELGDFGKSITLSVEFDTVKDRDAAKALLKQMAQERKRKAGRLVLDLLRAAGAGKRGKTAA
jgi:ParB-like chromosome segregation protein Spo0J